MANIYYTQGKVGQLSGSFQWGTTVMNVALLNSSYSTSSALSHSAWSHVSASEISGTGYTAKGTPIAGIGTGSETNSHGSVSATNTAWAASTITANWAVVYATATSLLVGAYDFGGSQTTSTGTFTISWHSSDGVLTLS
jgi:hypothetical protein